ncbi:hypothetical protein [Thalassococcus sp. BH17M4-6]|uniref:hypothetical protein n=1 Tax=Thalassococcus sp. BH17M4-6 TaxID=3413148 RepID=UPI003BF4824B
MHRATDRHKSVKNSVRSQRLTRKIYFSFNYFMRLQLCPINEQINEVRRIAGKIPVASGLHPDLSTETGDAFGVVQGLGFLQQQHRIKTMGAGVEN